MNKTIRRKTNLEPLTITLDVPDTDERGEDITRQLVIRCVPAILGEQMLDIAQLQEVSVFDGVRKLFDAAILPDDRPKWDEFLKSPNGPDLDELLDLNNDLVAKYSSRVEENPTQGSD